MLDTLPSPDILLDLIHRPLLLLQENREALLGFAQAQGWRAVLGFLLLDIALLACTLPLNIPFSLAAGLMFGLGEGVLLASLATASGATLSCLLSRTLLRGWVTRRFGRRLAAVEARLAGGEAVYLFSLRLMPVVPYTLVNLVFGLTRFRLEKFFAITWIATLPATALYVSAGTVLAVLGQSGSVIAPGFLVALTVLALLPVAVFRLRQSGKLFNASRLP